MRTGWIPMVVAVVATASSAAAQPTEPAPEPAPAPAPAPAEPPPASVEPDAPSLVTPGGSGPDSFKPSAIAIHGFVSAGAFVTTRNEYLGNSSRGSIDLFEAGLNVSSEVADRLRVGLQLYGRKFGQFRDLPPRLDWAFIDYRWKRELGLRAGIIKMPYGLYNEYADVDTSKPALLLPQSVYPLRNRSALLSHNGFSVYGNPTLGAAGELEYQAFAGTLDIPENALILGGGVTLDSIDARYVVGAQVFWRPPIEGLKIGGTLIRSSIDFELTLPQSTVDALIMAGLVPADYAGALTISQRPNHWAIGSVEYVHDDWLFAAEYARTYKRQISSLPVLLPTVRERDERFYVLLARRVAKQLELGAYYSHLYVDPGDRDGSDTTKFAQPILAYQRDLAATVRYDVNDHWTWKVETHFIDGAADLEAAANPMPRRYWGLALVKTTVMF